MLSFTERVEEFVQRVPPGRVVTYGDVAAVLGAGTAQGVGNVMARSMGSLEWWRVVRADGGLDTSLVDEAEEHWDAERIWHTAGRCDLARHRLTDDELVAIQRVVDSPRGRLRA